MDILVAKLKNRLRDAGGAYDDEAVDIIAQVSALCAIAPTHLVETSISKFGSARAVLTSTGTNRQKLQAIKGVRSISTMCGPQLGLKDAQAVVDTADSQQMSVIASNLSIAKANEMIQSFNLEYGESGYYAVVG